MNPPGHDGLHQRRMAELELAEAGQQGPEDRRGLEVWDPGDQLGTQSLHCGLVLPSNINQTVSRSRGYRDRLNLKREFVEAVETV